MTVPRQMVSITVRDGQGVSHEKTEKIMRFLAKHAHEDTWFLVVEKANLGDEAHYHGGIVYEDPKHPYNVRTQLLRLFPNYTPDQKKHAIKCLHWFNEDWYGKYCRKEVDHIMLKDLPDHLEYPDDYPFADVNDEQDKKKNIPNKWYMDLKKKILEDPRREDNELFQPPWNEDKLSAIVNTYIFKDNTLQLPSHDASQLRNRVRYLNRFMNEYDGPGYINKKLKTEKQEDLEHTYCPRCDEIQFPYTRVVYKKPPLGHKWDSEDSEDEE